MTIEAQRPTRPSGWHSFDPGQLLFGQVIPLVFCTILLLPKVSQVVQLISQGPLGDARGIYEVLHLVLSAVFLTVMAFLFVARKKTIDTNASWTGRLVALAGTLSPMFLAVGEPAQLSDSMLLTSLIAVLLGDVLMIWALASLGSCFGVFPAARGLVTRGPYRFVRHPLYTAEAVAIFGFLLTRLGPATVAIYITFMALQAWRTVNEERVLEQVFPEYADYRRRAGRFLPRFR